MLIGKCHRAARALGGGALDGARHRGGVSRDHHLARGIEVDRFHDLSLRRFLARRLDVRILEAQYCRNRPLTVRHRSLHEFTAIFHQVHGRS